MSFVIQKLQIIYSVEGNQFQRGNQQCMCWQMEEGPKVPINALDDESGNMLAKFIMKSLYLLLVTINLPHNDHNKILRPHLGDERSSNQIYIFVDKEWPQVVCATCLTASNNFWMNRVPPKTRFVPLAHLMVRYLLSKLSAIKAESVDGQFCLKCTPFIQI